jgi:hypothetical protein
MFNALKYVFIGGLWLCSAAAHASEESRTTAAPDNTAAGELMAQLLTLRNSFVGAVKSEGYRIRLPAPTIVLDNPPSYGEFEDSKNVLHIAAWPALTDQQRSRFERLSKLLDNGKSAEQTFDESVHHWVFVHELGHWWQASQGKKSSNHYSAEYGANRIAAAYWRQTNPDFMQQTENRMSTVIATIKSPLPAGQIKEAYFNENYEALGPTPAYIWFQYTMVLSVQAERPLPSFKQALTQPIFP